ncbi:hypothetical protein D1007_57797 [Hordeum vulgare]|nr:hypothetical protein D1007_57797 [Hordeum vulgare]
MEASQSSLVNVEVAHAQSPPADLVAGHVNPVVAQGTNAPARKRQGNVVVQGGNPAGPATEARASGAAITVRSIRSPTEKVSKVSSMKRNKVPTKSTVPSSTPPVSARCSPSMPFNGVASTADEVFDEMVGRRRPLAPPSPWLAPGKVVAVKLIAFLPPRQHQENAANQEDPFPQQAAVDRLCIHDIHDGPLPPLLRRDLP